jgi:8-oxo-dGTP pyrophosphatase MutT (NUDIX family)
MISVDFVHCFPSFHSPHADEDIAWVNHPNTTPELLFIRRSPSPSSSTPTNPNSSSSRWSSHIAFPGGRHEPSDESAMYTALRETWEEIGVDLAEKDFIMVGRLDEREITTSLGKRLLMILSPFGECMVVERMSKLHGDQRRGLEKGIRTEGYSGY